MALTREQILAAPDLGLVKVPVPQWGGEVLIRRMTADDRDRFEQMMRERATIGADGKTRANMVGVRATMLALCLVDEAGERLFTEADIAALGGKSAEAVDLIFAEVQRANALSDDDIKALEKNLPSGPSAASSSASRKRSEKPSRK